MSEHTNGRMSWVRRRDGSLIYVIGDPKNGPHAQGDIYIGENDLRRMTAAWNACEGISTEQLEAAPYKDSAAFMAYLKVEAQRDDLLAVLKEASDHLAELYAKYQTKIGPFASQSQLINVKARAAIAKTEAGRGEG